MYAYIEGTIEAVTENAVIVDNHGIGYEIAMSTTAMSRLSGESGLVRIYTYFHVAENGIGLYGFLTREEKQLYLLLTSVNGVGPKAGMSILGTLSADDLRFAILAEDVKAISAAPGIGPKTAKRIILDLKDKLDAEEVITARMDAGGGSTGQPSAKNDAIEALVALGYSSSEALRAVSALELTEETPVETWIKEALRHMI